MNRSAIRYICGRVYGIFALLLVIPLVVSLIYRESWMICQSWLVTIGGSAAVYFLLGRKEPEDITMYARDGMVICALLWISLSLVGGMPLYLSGQYPTIVDAFFEISSGLTTTGASVSTNVEALSHSILFWRSLTHLIGGMGVLVFFLALIPRASGTSVQIAKAEMPGPTFGKIVARLSDTARILYSLYLSMTAVLVLLLLLGGMPLFDALCHAFGTAGTGGFGIYNASVGYYHSAYIEWVLAIGMLVFGVNMNLYYFVLIGKARELFHDEEFRWYIGFAAAFIVAIYLSIAAPYAIRGFGLERTLRDASFSLISLMSTTGFATVDFSKWPLFARVVLMLSMIVGGCGGSTAGGFKVSRVALSLKTTMHTLIQSRHPRQVVPLHFNGEVVSESKRKLLHGYLAIYCFIVIFLLLVVSLDPYSDTLETALSSVLATFNNIGPGIGLVVGPSGNFAGYLPWTKIILSLGMIAGRLEIWPILILFTPRTWKKL